MRFSNRTEAGCLLAEGLTRYRGKKNVVVLGLPRGGVPVAAEIARVLRAPLDVLVVRKLGVPGFSELAMGAVATGGSRVLNRDVISAFRVSDEVVEQVARREEWEVQRRELAWRQDRPQLEIPGHTVILVDDGLATGMTMRAAISAVRAFGPARVVVAVPVAAPDALDEVRAMVDEAVCVLAPEPFHAVGEFYEDFTATTDGEVAQCLAAHTAPA